MARRGIRIVVWGAGTLVVLAVAVVLSLRRARHGHQSPVLVQPNLMQVHNLFADVYGIRAGKRVVLIDAGLDPQGGAIDALLGALGARREDVSDVFLTHGHFDHIAGAPLFPQARIHIGIRDADMAAQVAPTRPAAASWLARVFPVDPVHATDGLIDRAEIPLGDGTSLLAIPLPGHTPGSYVYLWKGVLFVGDSIQNHGRQLDFAMRAFSIDPAENRRSIATLLQSLRGAKVERICTGHQGCTSPTETDRMLKDLIERASS